MLKKALPFTNFYISLPQSGALTSIGPPVSKWDRK